jgi:F1F0 ATPase subunit 2
MGRIVNVTALQLVFAFLGGAGLGVFYFLGLWWTVQKLPSARSPALLSLASFAVRTAVVLTGFYFIMGGQWERLMACLVGFVGARIVLLRRLKPRTHRKNI